MTESVWNNGAYNMESVSDKGNFAKIKSSIKTDEPDGI